MANAGLKLSRGLPGMLMNFSAGVILGFSMTVWLTVLMVPDKHVGQRGVSGHLSGAIGQDKITRPDSTHQLKYKGHIYVGIMTAKKYLNSRALATYETWGKQISGKVEFFSATDSKASVGNKIPIVAIPGITDVYPPQKKAFLMLKYMHDHYLDKYEWFVRADDDVYIRGDRLENFLRKVDSSQALYIGQAGVGKDDEFGRLGLRPDENYCMGGPGMIMSRETLRRVVPNIPWCLKNLYSSHEDVEVGRCITKFAGITCTSAFDTRDIFFNDYKNYNKGNIGELHKVVIDSAITLHPNKRPEYQYKLHTYLLNQRIHDLKLHAFDLHHRVEQMTELLEPKLPARAYSRWEKHLQSNFHPREARDVLPWDAVVGKMLYQHMTTKSGEPSRKSSAVLKAAMDMNIIQAMHTVNRDYQRRYRTSCDYSSINHGYQRVDPIRGPDYKLDLLVVCRRKVKRKARMMLGRKSLYLHQSYTDVEFLEKDWKENVLDHVISDMAPRSAIKETVHIIVPLHGRLSIFERFMKNYEAVCLETDSNVELLIILFKTTEAETSRVLDVLDEYREKYPASTIKVILMTEPFSRGIGLNAGASHFGNNSLLFLCDVDLIFTENFFDRCRGNAVLGRQVYFPVMFSQYDPQFADVGNTASGDQSNRKGGPTAVGYHLLTKDTGYWRFSSYGMACLYRQDFVNVGQFDTSIRGWGFEDLSLFEKFVKSKVETFRAVDPGLIHVYHPIHCDPNLPAIQYSMCIGSKTNTYGSAASLARFWQEQM
ncbi:chondroitin sulfate synthase 3-like [Branchiostoma lanceolatum]|uniref:chondroitin sulfate synthase 3-like n=1 Tax=Branchiostoma lanceolatum TaxID=7740 RepID=UPI003452A778